MINDLFNIFLIVMSILALIVFIALHFFEAGYGYLFNPKYGAPISNRVGWVVMESPVFIAMTILWICSDRAFQIAPLLLFLLFESHYLWRSFIFPMLMKGNSKMPIGIVVMGAIFNTLNAIMQGGWIFYIAPESYYDNWFGQPYIYIGSTLFFLGMYINRQSDSIIRHLRKEGDTQHYIPHGGMFKYVSSANYFGELLEWVGFAIAAWSLPALVFVWWSFANLAPRSASLYMRYEAEFGEEFTTLKRKRIIPFIY